MTSSKSKKLDKKLLSQGSRGMPYLFPSLLSRKKKVDRRSVFLSPLFFFLSFFFFSLDAYLSFSRPLCL